MFYKTKSQVRQETSEAVEKFLRSGGVIEVIKARKTRKRTQQKMVARPSRSFNTGTSGFATGYPSKSTGA